jgi:hypothetical protein
VVVGSIPGPSRLLAEANNVLRSLSIDGVDPTRKAVRAFDQTPSQPARVGPGPRRIM